MNNNLFWNKIYKIYKVNLNINWKIYEFVNLDNSFYFIYNHDNMSKMALAENFKSSHSRKIRMD